MKIERTKNAKRNIVTGLLNKVVVLLLPFLVRTVFIYNLGAEYLGLNSLFTSILHVLNITELGFSSAVVYSMYAPIAQNDHPTICALLNFYKKAYRAIGLIVFSVGMCLLPFLPHLIKGNCPDELNIYVLYVIYLLNSSCSYLLFSYKKSILEAFQRRDIVTLVDLITVGLTNLVQFLLIILWHDVRVYYLYVASLLFFTIVNNFINAYITKKMYPQYVCCGKLDAAVYSTIKKQVSGLMISKLCQMTRISLNSIFVSAFIGLTMTTIYNNYYYVLNSVVGIMTVLSHAMLAGVGNSMVTETVEKNYKDFNKFNFMYMWIAGWAAITMFCLYQNFMILWVGKELTLAVEISLLFSLYFYVLKIGDMRATYSSAAGLWWETRKISVIEVVANVSLNYLFIRLWGIQGIIAATMIPILLINNPLCFRVLNNNYFKMKKAPFVFFLKNLKYFVITIISGFITYKVCLLTPVGVLGLCSKLVICMFVPNLCFFILYIKDENYSDAKKWVVARFLKKKRS